MYRDVRVALASSLGFGECRVGEHGFASQSTCPSIRTALPNCRRSWLQEALVPHAMQKGLITQVGCVSVMSAAA